jgi:hypothetical protein
MGAGPLPIHVVPSGALLRHVSWARYAGTPLYFGRDRTCRYDAPDGAYGVLYVADALGTALMESVFHQNEWQQLEVCRSVAATRVEQTIVRHIKPRRDLRLFDLSEPGAATRCFGLNMEIMATRDYAALQRISQTIERMEAGAPGLRFDGLRYPSRNLTGFDCIALFDRSQSGAAPDPILQALLVADLPLTALDAWPEFVALYGVEVLKA